jgi:hypothetical protein
LYGPYTACHPFVAHRHLTIPIPDPEVEAALEKERLEQEGVLGIETIPESFEASHPSKWYPRPDSRVIEDNPDQQCHRTIL